MVAVLFFMIASWLGKITEKQATSYEELEEQDPGLCCAFTFMTMPLLMGMVLTGALVTFFVVLVVISAIDWVLISRRPSSWGAFAFINAGVDILAVLLLVSQIGPKQ